jgi:hypothetical protein
MSDTDRSTVATNTTTALATAVRDLGMSPAAALTDLRELSDVTGIGASISDEDIQNAAKQWRRLNLKPTSAADRRSSIRKAYWR